MEPKLPSFVHGYCLFSITVSLKEKEEEKKEEA